jgi:hypothetical protein
MPSADPTLKERVGRMHRRLLLLQRIFDLPRDTDSGSWLDTDDIPQGASLNGAIREVVDELTEHAKILTSIPSPIGDWQASDQNDDARWRGLTEIERREMLAIVSDYENLIAWSEEIARRPGLPPQKVTEALEHLRSERARVGRFRQEMGFLERRRVAG